MKKLVLAALAVSTLIFGAVPAFASSSTLIPMPQRNVDPSVQADFMIFVDQHQAAMAKFVPFPAGNASAWFAAKYTGQTPGTELVWKDQNGNYDRAIFF